MASKYKYTTKDGDTVDQIVNNFYGRTTGQIVETVLTANPGLSARGPILDAGVVITLPEIAQPEREQGVRLWD